MDQLPTRTVLVVGMAVIQDAMTMTTDLPTAVGAVVMATDQGASLAAIVSR